jgi:acyl-CoA synthetase (NDP forming)
VIVTPARTVAQILEDAGVAGIKAAVVMSTCI